MKKSDCHKVNNLKNRLKSSCVVTAGCTSDDNYSLSIQMFDGKPCLCVHKCEKYGGWHMSSLDDKSFVTAIGFDTLKWSVNEIEKRPPY